MKYEDKAKDSFKTKWNLYLFYCALNGINSVALNQFMNFTITDPLVDLYTTKYHQYEYEHEFEGSKGLTVREIMDKMAELDRLPMKQVCLSEYIKSFDTTFPRKDFDDIAASDKCFYCKISRQEFDLLYEQHKIRKKAARGWKLEMDRKNPHLEYTRENCVLACYWCNNAKTDEFSAAEFEPIGEAIGTALKSRLNPNKNERKRIL